MKLVLPTPSCSQFAPRGLRPQLNVRFGFPRRNGLSGGIWPTVSVRFAASSLVEVVRPPPEGWIIDLQRGAIWFIAEVRCNQDQRHPPSTSSAKEGQVNRREQKIILKCNPCRETKRC